MEVNSFVMDWGQKPIKLIFGDEEHRKGLKGIIRGNEGDMIIFVGTDDRKWLVHINEIKQVMELE